MLDCLLLTVQGQIYLGKKTLHRNERGNRQLGHNWDIKSLGKRTCSTIISKHSIEMREGTDNWDNELLEICESFLHRCLYEWNLWIFSSSCLYEWNLWMFSSSLFIWMKSVNAFFIVDYMNGILECFLTSLYKWMEYANVFAICLYEWNMWMFSLWLVYMNEICQCFLYDLFIWMVSVNGFFFVLYMNGI